MSVESPGKGLGGWHRSFARKVTSKGMSMFENLKLLFKTEVWGKKHTKSRRNW